MEKKLYRDEYRKSVGGVCAGLAEYFGVDVSVIRVVFVLSMLLKGVGLIPYIVLWIVLPKRPFNLNNPNYRPGVTPNPGYDPGAGFHPGYKPYGDVKVDYSVPPPNAINQPFGAYPPVKKPSNTGVMFGVVLIVLGTIFLLDQINIIPDFDFEKLWPVVLVAIGATLIFGSKKKPWEKENWAAGQDANAATTAESKTEENTSDNTPTL